MNRKDRRQQMKKNVYKKGALLLCAGILTCSLGAGYSLVGAEEENKGVLKLASESNGVAKGYMDVSDIVEKAMPSVVSITTKSIEEVQDYYSQYFFYGQGGGTREYEVEGAGSGIIISMGDNELLIVTNYHVVEGATNVTVTFNDGKTYEASIRGYDSDNDIAVVSISLDTISEDTMGAIEIATIGNSDELKVGQQVVAIGNALGYGQSVTTGIVSAKNRAIFGNNRISSVEDADTDDYTLLIQTDAAINPGNSGGALLNMNGEVVGINSAKMADTSVEGMGYSIAISNVTDILQELMTEEMRMQLGENESGVLGIAGYTVEPADHTKFGIPNGVYVQEITEGGGAEEAGLQPRTVITKLDKHRISSIEELKDRLTYYAPGEEVTLTIQVPDGAEYKEEEITIVLGENPKADANAKNEEQNLEENEEEGLLDEIDPEEFFPFGGGKKH